MSKINSSIFPQLWLSLDHMWGKRYSIIAKIALPCFFYFCLKVTFFWLLKNFLLGDVFKKQWTAEDFLAWGSEELNNQFLHSSFRNANDILYYFGVDIALCVIVLIFIAYVTMKLTLDQEKPSPRQGTYWPSKKAWSCVFSMLGLYFGLCLPIALASLLSLGLVWGGMPLVYLPIVFIVIIFLPLWLCGRFMFAPQNILTREDSGALRLSWRQTKNKFLKLFATLICLGLVALAASLTEFFIIGVAFDYFGSMVSGLGTTILLVAEYAIEAGVSAVFVVWAATFLTRVWARVFAKA